MCQATSKSRGWLRNVDEKGNICESKWTNGRIASGDDRKCVQKHETVFSSHFLSGSRGHGIPPRSQRQFCDPSARNHKMSFPVHGMPKGQRKQNITTFRPIG
ncbi:hypothetical protein L596_013903 [Steinernema carpocapsae]|uniref:Uncharacterized protein n=1 Tax=Steinernema carpocapsae TaxID=34508 RepID=A0A4U5P1P4_STECR|nr:hypothetical protein L596_013903 [Steinernema carpocapsae]